MKCNIMQTNLIPKQTQTTNVMMYQCSAKCMWCQQEQTVTHRRMENRQSDPFVALCFAGARCRTSES